MTNARQSNWASYGYYIFCALFMAGCLLTIVYAEFGIELSRLGLTSIAPENLARAPKSFWLALRVEAPDVALEEMTKTKAWTNLQEKVSAYAERLELLERQRRVLSRWILLTYLAASIGMIVTVRYARKTVKMGLS